MCQDRELVYGFIGQVWEPFLGPPGCVPWLSSALLIPVGNTTNIPRNIPSQPSLPSRCSSLSPLFLLLALLFPHHLLSHSGAQPFLSQLHHPHHLHQLTHGASPCPPPFQPLFQSSQGSPALFPCARAPGAAPNCSSQVTDWHFWGQSDLHNSCGQEGATDGFGNPTTPSSKGPNTENSSVTPGIIWELGRDVPLDLSSSTPDGPSRFAAP